MPKLGHSTEQQDKGPLANCRRVVDGRTEIEIDMLRGILIVDGLDRYAEIMAIISS